MFEKIKKDIAEKFKFLITLSPEHDLTTIEKNLMINKENGKALLKSYNGSLKLTGSEKNIFSLTVKYAKKNHKAKIRVDEEGLHYNKEDFLSVSVEAKIPSYFFKTIDAEVTNGSLEVSSLNSNNLSIVCVNSQASLKNIKFKELSLDGKNTDINMKSFTGDKLIAKSTNKKVSFTNLDINFLDFKGFSSQTVFSVVKFEKYKNYNFSIISKDADIVMHTSKSARVSYNIDAKSDHTLNVNLFPDDGANTQVNITAFSHNGSLKLD